MELVPLICELVLAWSLIKMLEQVSVPYQTEVIKGLIQRDVNAEVSNRVNLYEADESKILSAFINLR